MSDSQRSQPRPTTLATLLVAAVVALSAALIGPASALAGKGFQAATTGHDSELIETAPIERDAKSSRRVAFSLGPKQLPTLRAGDDPKWQAIGDSDRFTLKFVK